VISLLAFVLECAAVAALVGTAAGLLTLASLRAARPVVSSLRAAVRADLVLLLGLWPALAVVAMVAAAAAPSVASVLGFGPDHCLGHEHHLHICFLHSSGPRPALAALGAFALAVWIYRLASLIRGAVRLGSTSRHLERFAWAARASFPVLRVPGSTLCHATGLFRRRILLSAELADRLSSDQLASALAHEEAHLQRRDPLASFLLAVATLFVWPGVAQRLRRLHRQAAEEACDAAAAKVMGDGAVVAGALVEVAALQRELGPGARFAAPAFGTHALEIRVAALLEDRAVSQSSSSRWGWLALVTTAAFVALAYRQAEWLHHSTETVLGRIL
jgi:Zn-dependent protease with chaperone function